MKGFVVRDLALMELIIYRLDLGSLSRFYSILKLGRLRLSFFYWFLEFSNKIIWASIYSFFVELDMAQVCNH